MRRPTVFVRALCKVPRDWAESRQLPARSDACQLLDHGARNQVDAVDNVGHHAVLVGYHAHTRAFSEPATCPCRLRRGLGISSFSRDRCPSWGARWCPAGSGPQTRAMQENIKSCLEIAGASMADILKTIVWLRDRDVGAGCQGASPCAECGDRGSLRMGGTIEQVPPGFGAGP